MNWKLWILVLLALGHGYRLALNILQKRSAANPVPANVADVYDAETYQRWRAYNGEKSALGILSTLISLAVTGVLLGMNVYAAVAAWFPEGIFWQMFAVLLLTTLVDTLVNVGLSWYETMVIEEKYGFNRSSVKTFVTDQIRGFLLEFLLSFALTGALIGVHQWLGDWMILAFAIVVFLFSLLISFLYPIFSRLGNKFVPLEEGDLKDRLMGLLTKHGYQVKAIEVMDASRRTTKLNAYFTGFGKMKTIVLYDNLVNAATPGEICAVFAHELGHGLHKDVLKQQVMNFGNLLIMAAVVWLAVREPALHEAFGFGQVNYGLAYVLLGVGLGLVQPLTGMAMSAYSRFAEYRADRQAVEEGYGEDLITGLKKLSRENFADLAPAKALVILEYSHPPLSERITAIEKELKK